MADFGLNPQNNSVPATSGIGVARLVLFDISAAWLLAYQFRLLPEDLDLTTFVPFCALVGGFSGAARAIVFNDPDEFPKAESFRGALYGTIFGFFFICFGAL